MRVKKGSIGGTPYPELNDVACNGGTAIAFRTGPAQVSVVRAPVSDLHV